MWRQLDETREFFDADGFIIVRAIESNDTSPLFCHICRCPAPSSDDRMTNQRDGCCSLCSLKWVDPRREEWEAGWRPDQDEIATEIERRYARPRPIPI